MSLGLWQDRPAAEVVRTAQAADALGYGEIWIGEMATFDAFALGAVVAEPRPDQAVTLAEIVAYLRDLGIATFKLPERLELRDELPRNALGKILKRELRDELRD